MGSHSAPFSWRTALHQDRVHAQVIPSLEVDRQSQWCTLFFAMRLKWTELMAL
jgi:hypothetical protein